MVVSAMTERQVIRYRGCDRGFLSRWTVGMGMGDVKGGGKPGLFMLQPSVESPREVLGLKRH